VLLCDTGGAAPVAPRDLVAAGLARLETSLAGLARPRTSLAGAGAERTKSVSFWLFSHLAVRRSVRAGGDTKTRKSRRSIALQARCVTALRNLRNPQEREREKAGDRWQDLGLVFTARYGRPLNKDGVRRDFRTAIKTAEGIDPGQWTPCELRHSFVSLLSDNKVPLERNSLLIGHKSSLVTELAYRHQIRPVLQDGAEVMDSISGGGRE
jgi:integrase